MALEAAALELKLCILREKPQESFPKTLYQHHTSASTLCRAPNPQHVTSLCPPSPYLQIPDLDLRIHRPCSKNEPVRVELGTSESCKDTGRRFGGLGGFSDF